MVTARTTPADFPFQKCSAESQRLNFAAVKGTESSEEVDLRKTITIDRKREMNLEMGKR